tara:strand:+ start:175 stop:2112 length:1938 start_codon:yes stop_codon:yes gene_type:complete
MANWQKNYTSDFWLDNDNSYDVLTGDYIKPSKDYAKIAATKRAISNFVSIVTGQSIPVKYSSKDDSYTDGKQVVLSSNIKDKDFDPTVGLALHEGSHCKLTDFDTLKNLMDNPNVIPQDIFDMIANKYAKNADDLEDKTWIVCNYIRNHVKSLLNYVEDRRIDNFIYQSAPGYQGYYQAMYNKYFHSKIVDKGLQSNEKRNLDWDSYFFRIINLTNINRDMDALPGLKDIWKLLDLRNIGRLRTTQDALDIAFKIFTIVESHLPEPTEEDKQESGDKKQGKQNPNAKKLSANQVSSLQKAINKAKDFVDGNVKKSTMSKSDKKKVEAIDSSGSEIKTVGNGMPGKYYGTKSTGTECLVVNNLTFKLAEAQVYDTFRHYEGDWRIGTSEEIINDGFRLGTMLGKKIQVRNEAKSLKYNRLRQGKIDRRMISSLGFGNEQVFSQIFIDQFNPAVVHISIDASGSMSGNKWNKSQTAAIAIAKAASMVTNLDIVISYRSTEEIGNQIKPAIFIAYDSRKDNINKIRKIFKYIHCPGITPEGLCFEAIEKKIVDGDNGVDSYFINFSDGEPYFENKDINYYGLAAYNHTKKQVQNMRARGIKVLSYFISGKYSSDIANFKKMYGKDAENVNVTKLIDLARTINKTFATK